MTGMKLNPDWLEDQDSRDKASCYVCGMVLDVPTTACPEGHALCRDCWVAEKTPRQRCPLCQHRTDASRLQRCRPLEDFIGDLRMCCMHGPEGEGGEEDANLEPLGEQWCSWRGKVCEFAAHLAVCGHEEEECPCPGCEQRVARAEVEKHMEEWGEVHLRRAWGRAVEMEEKVAEQGRTISELHTQVAGQGETIARQNGDIQRQNGDIQRQNSVIASLQRRSEALTRVFTWSTDSAWRITESLPYTFTDGVRGFCSNGEPANENFTHWIGFSLEEGPACTMHFQCSILDTNDKVLSVVSQPADGDFQMPSVGTAPVGGGKGSSFDLSEEDKAGAERADGSIKLRMAVHLYLPE